MIRTLCWDWKIRYTHYVCTSTNKDLLIWYSVSQNIKKKFQLLTCTFFSIWLLFLKFVLHSSLFTYFHYFRHLLDTMIYSGIEQISSFPRILEDHENYFWRTPYIYIHSHYAPSSFLFLLLSEKFDQNSSNLTGTLDW